MSKTPKRKAVTDKDVTAQDVECWKMEHPIVYEDYIKVYGWDLAQYYAKVGARATAIIRASRRNK